jgi:pyruvate formate lyase activating enzyme
MIAAVEPCSFVDFPGRLAAVAFTQGCNLRCRYCHNPELCERRPTNPRVAQEFRQLLLRRRGLLTGVVISGGEPTLWPELEHLLAEIRAQGFAVKLDSNGTRPDLTRRLLDLGLVDCLAVDIKAAPGAASRWICGHEYQAHLALQTLSHAVARNIACEARTVLVRRVHDRHSLSWIAHRLADNRIPRWRLTDVRPGLVLDPTAFMEPPQETIVDEVLPMARSLGLEVRWTAFQISSHPP